MAFEEGSNAVELAQADFGAAEVEALEAKTSIVATYPAAAS